MRVTLNKLEISKAIEFYLRQFQEYTCDETKIEFSLDSKHDEVEATVEVTKLERERE